MNDRLTPHIALTKLAQAEGTELLEVFRHGTLEVEFYKPNKIDRQQVHKRDEIYVVVSGTGYFVKGFERCPFQTGEFIFVPAGVEHWFDDFSDDFATWVFFYGPEGGEQ